MSSYVPLNSPLWAKEPDYTQPLGYGLGLAPYGGHSALTGHDGWLSLEQQFWTSNNDLSPSSNLSSSTFHEPGTPLLPGYQTGASMLSLVQEQDTDDDHDELLELGEYFEPLAVAIGSDALILTPTSVNQPERDFQFQSSMLSSAGSSTSIPIRSPAASSSSSTSSSSSSLKKRAKPTKRTGIKKPRKPFLHEMDTTGMTDKKLKNRIRSAKNSKKYREKMAEMVNAKGVQCLRICHDQKLLLKIQHLLDLQIAEHGGDMAASH